MSEIALEEWIGSPACRDLFDLAARESTKPAKNEYREVGL
ncbi:MAG: hypothetical protein ACI9BW_004477 [Gammaproteobacteria bacterium]|jgi:hypothetical protein